MGWSQQGRTVTAATYVTASSYVHMWLLAACGLGFLHVISSLLCVDRVACCLVLQMLPDQLGFAIVDEVDSILIDESRNPMIISQPRGDNGHMVITVDKVRHVGLPPGLGCCPLPLLCQGVVCMVVNSQGTQ
jgi:hypothetical protein